MPGEQLTCVWQAVWVLDVNKKCATGAPVEVVKKVTSMLRSLQSVHYSDIIFNETFSGPTIELKKYKDYVQKSLREKGVSYGFLGDNIEDICWDIVKPLYKTSLSEAELKKLWKICNRLINEETYPVKMCKDEACWLTNKILGSIGNIIKSTDEMFKNETLSFGDFVQILDDMVFKETTHDKLKVCIDDLYSWLVAEILKKDKVYMRCKKQSNWTTWGKRCCVLTPRSVSIYSGDLSKLDTSTGVKKVELVITKSTKIESLPMYSGIIHHLKGRFSIANHPVMEVEIAVDDDSEKRSWLTALEDAITCCKENTTPVQKLLHERYTKRLQKSHSNIAKSDSLEKLESSLDESHKRVSQAVFNKIDQRPEPTVQVQIIDTAGKVTSKPPKKHAGGKNNDTNGKQQPKAKVNISEVNRQKLKAVFVKIDENGNGLLDKAEFTKFIHGLGLNMSDKELNLVFNTVDTSKKGQVTFDQFETYFSKYVLNETSTEECVNALRKAFLDADRDGSGTLNFREFTEYVWEKKRSIRMSKIMSAFNNKGVDDEITFTDFQQMIQGGNTDVLTTILEDEADDTSVDDSSLNKFQNQLKQAYSDTDAEELAGYIRERWKKFATFRRQGNSGTIVMKGGHGMVADFVPGEYSLIDLTCFSDLPPLVPKYTAVKGVTWVASTIPGKSGKIIFPSGFDGKVVTDVATTELVRYYGCSFADANQEKVSLLYRHGIQDFTYENGYLEKYVTSTNGGAGIERHEFSHLDCPLTSDSGTFVLAKFTDDGEFHITGFKIPVRHTLYIPGGCIHSNDYLKGTWRTMLSDETDIDHVHLTKKNDFHGDEIYDNNVTKFQFMFV